MAVLVLVSSLLSLFLFLQLLIGFKLVPHFFETDQNIKSEKFFRIVNEVPTVAMIAIVIFVVIKPF